MAAEVYPLDESVSTDVTMDPEVLARLAAHHKDRAVRRRAASKLNLLVDPVQAQRLIEAASSPAE